MKISVFHKFSAFLLLFLAAGFASASTALPQAQLDRVYDSTFEVVIRKIEKDSLSYERPLPLDKIPFQVRTDKYWSIGTAFAIGEDRFVSAAHVFGLTTETQYQGFGLRDRNGKVYPVDEVIKYSENRDFIVFSVKGFKTKTFLGTSEKPVMNTRVYAVGNANGEGVVLRDGLYTSNTPEDLDGAWSWIRFSAAASPGNSGGPLLDKDGQVIGIVLRKSENENLNFALPIRELLKAPNNLAVINRQMGYSMENMNLRKIGRMKYKTRLPKSVEKLNAELSSAVSKFTLGVFEQAVEERKDTIFPRGKGSQYLLGTTYTATFPNIVWEKNDGRWVPFTPQETNRADLGNNGILRYGSMENTLLFRIRKPDDRKYKDFIGDGKSHMDYLFKSIKLTRNIGPEEIRITSLGKPVLEKTHRDHYGRVWTLRKWLVEYDDSAVATMTLPIPGGSITMMRSDSTGIIDSHIVDLKVLSDYLYLTYYGTAKEWQEYFAMKDMVPETLRSVKLDYKPGKSLRFQSDDIKFDYDNSLMPISDKSQLRLYMSYVERKGKVTWDIARVMIGQDKHSDTFFAVSRYVRPGESMSDAAKSDWMRLAKQSFPYNKSSYFKEKNTYIGALYSTGVTVDNLQDKSELYSVYHGSEGKLAQTEAEQKINAFIKNLKIDAD